MSDKIDGRTLRRTGRVHQFATRVTEDFRDRVDAISERDAPSGHRRKQIAVILEEAVDAYEATGGGSALACLHAAWQRASDAEKTEFVEFVRSWGPTLKRAPRPRKGAKGPSPES